MLCLTDDGTRLGKVLKIPSCHMCLFKPTCLHSSYIAYDIFESLQLTSLKHHKNILFVQLPNFLKMSIHTDGVMIGNGNV